MMAWFGGSKSDKDKDKDKGKTGVNEGGNMGGGNTPSNGGVMYPGTSQGNYTAANPRGPEGGQQIGGTRVYGDVYPQGAYKQDKPTNQQYTPNYNNSTQYSKTSQPTYSNDPSMSYHFLISI